MAETSTVALVAVAINVDATGLGIMRRQRIVKGIGSVDIYGDWSWGRRCPESNPLWEAVRSALVDRIVALVARAAVTDLTGMVNAFFMARAQTPDSRPESSQFKAEGHSWQQINWL